MVDLRKPLAAIIIVALLSACAPQLARPPEAARHPPENFPVFM
jgi:hypothetical protein